MRISNNTLKDAIDSSLISNDELSIVKLFYRVDDVSKELIIKSSPSNIDLLKNNYITLEHLINIAK